MSTDDILDQTAAEIVEDLLEATAHEGVPWFPIVRAKLAALAKDLRERRRK